jgi:enhancing lycopene biosynthesis protein 2
MLSNTIRRMASQRVAVILAGSGVYDGTEIHEASATLVALSRANAQVSMFAPDKEQLHAIDHTKGAPHDNTRNVLQESARIARGKVEPLDVLDQSNFDALIVPGGFGAAKNLSDWALKGPDCTVDITVEKIIKSFHENKKPMGFCCIAPHLAAKVIPGCSLTVGSADSQGGKFPYAEVAGAIESLGCKHVETTVSEAHIDEDNKIVTTAAYMCETAVHEIHDGVAKMVNEVIKLC